MGAEDDRHRFEWGYGWTVDVPEHALTVDGRPVAGRLFHGDRVDAVRLDPDPDVPGAIAVRLAGRDVATAVSGQLMRESVAGMVHHIRVEVDLARGRVAVLGVDTQRQRGTDERIDVLTHPVDGEIEPTTAAELIERERRRTRSGTVTRNLCARLDTSATARQGRRKVFTLVDPARLRDGDLLYARAHRIVDVGNELCLELRPLGPAGRRWTVSVARRQFSRRGRSPRATAQGPEGGRRLPGAPVHGEVAEEGTESRGPVARLGPRHAGPPRGPPGQPGAPSGRGLLRRAGQGRLPRGRSRCLLRRRRRARCHPARRRDPRPAADLRAVSEAGLDVAVPSNLRYIRGGRPAIALPKNSLLGPGGLGKARGGNPFTLADLPAVEGAAHRDLDPRDLLRTPHPKVVHAVGAADAGRAQLRPVDPRTVVGTLTVDTLGPARLTPVGGGATHDIDWAQLSFAEGGIAALRRAIREGDWEYHDTTTGYWDAEGRKCEPQELGPGIRRALAGLLRRPGGRPSAIPTTSCCAWAFRPPSCWTGRSPPIPPMKPTSSPRPARSAVSGRSGWS